MSGQTGLAKFCRKKKTRILPHLLSLTANQNGGQSLLEKSTFLELRLIVLSALFQWHSCEPEKLMFCPRSHNVSNKCKSRTSRRQGQSLRRTSLVLGFCTQGLWDQTSNKHGWARLIWAHPSSLWRPFADHHFMLADLSELPPPVNASNNIWLHASQGWEDKWGNKGES